METKNREKTLLIIVVAFIGLLVLNYLLITPLWNGWNDRQAKIQDLKNKIKNGQLLITNSAGSIEAQWSRMAKNTLPPDNTAAENILFSNFQKWAGTSRVVLVGQKPQQKDSDDPAYSNYEWHADVTGSLEQIFSFLYSVESGPLGLRVDSVELASRDDLGQQLALGLTVSGLILNPETNNPPASN
jgi:hypothetical protein